MTLPVLVTFHQDETPLSLTSRLAAVNGYRSLQEFLRFAEVDIRSLQSGAPEAINQLSRWSGIEAAKLARNVTSAASAGGTWKLGGALMSKDMRPGKKHRFCPRCVKQDLECAGDRPIARPYIRVSWMSRGLSYCPKHRCQIAEVEAEAETVGDFPRFIAGYRHELETAAKETSEAASVSVDEYVVARINGKGTNDFLDRLEAYVAIDLCRYLGRFEKQHSGEIEKHYPRRDVELGFAWASKGRTGIEQLVTDAIERVRPIAHEMNDFFGDLRKWLKRNRDKEEYGSLVELFQDIAERCLPIGPNELFLIPSRTRHLHSVRSASAEFGMIEERVVELLSQAGMLEPSSSLTSSQIYFDAEKAYPILKEAADALTTGDMSRLLGVTVDRMRAIVSADLLPCVENRDDSGRTFTRVHRRDFEAFRNKLLGRPATPEELHERHSIFRVTKVCNCRIEEVLKLAVEGRISLVRSGDELGKLWIDPVELRTQLARELTHTSDVTTLDLLNVRQAERRLKLASGSISELIKRAFIETQFAENPETRKWQAYIKASSVEEFARRHLSINQLSERTGIFPTKLRKALEANGVQPIFVPKGRMSLLYRRSDVRDFMGSLAA